MHTTLLKNLLRVWLVAVAATVFATILLISLPPITVQAASTLPAGFQEEAVLSGLTNPTNVEFSADGRVFVAEKSGMIKVFDSLSDTTPTTFADLRTQVHNFWDRGLLGLALDPNFPANPYVYVAYTRDAAIGGTTPRWGTPGVTSDPCPTPPGATADGCVVSGRLSRLRADPATNTMTGSEEPLITDWCQQYPSHSIGNLDFGADGALYASGGEGASFNFIDYGQVGDPLNPCGDPPTGVGGTQAPPTAEGGSLRAQDLRTSGDKVGLSGALLRIDSATGNALPTNPLIGNTDINARRIVAYGLRNPFRFTIKSGTNEVWLGDVGGGTFEEIDRISNPTDSFVENFGWPCYEGNERKPNWDSINLNVCENLYGKPGAVTAPYYAYAHNVQVVAGEACGIDGGSSIAGLAFYEEGGYPDSYDDALFFADYSRDCIWAMKEGTNGLPDPASMETFVAGAASPVDLQVGPDGDLFYADFDGGTIRRLRYSAGNQLPIARATVNPTSGLLPLTVNFDGTSSSDPDGGALSYRWDLDGDGAYDDSTAPKPTYKYTAAKNYRVDLKVTDSAGVIDTLDQPLTISAGNTPPQAIIGSPLYSVTWHVGRQISFSGSGSDEQDGTLAPFKMDWSLILHHCSSVDDCHEHPAQDFAGVSQGVFVGPDHEYPTYLELRLTVTDSRGLTDTQSVRLDPQTVRLDFKTNPTGLKLAVDDTLAATPFSRTVIVGSRNSISAPSPQSLSGESYAFSSWSDGGARTHDITTGAQPSTLTATYTPGGAGGSCTITGTSAGETLTGTSGDDVICARGGNDTIKGLGGDDVLRGEDGNDNLLGGGGNDALEGGAGTDNVSHSASLTAVIASLATNTATGEGSDTFSGVENLQGSPKDDTLTGSTTNNTLAGGAGIDTLRGGGGNDNLIGGTGSDSFAGGLGTDTAHYAASLTAVVASLATNTATGEGSDTFSGLENLLGSPNDDTLTGSAASNTLTGRGGNDKVVGGGGADILKGEDGADAIDSKDGVNGNDALDGGLGTDTKTTDATEKSIVGFP